MTRLAISNRSRGLRAAIAVSVALGMGCALRAQVPCRYEVDHIIQGPGCGGAGAAITDALAISPNGHWVVGNRWCPGGFMRAFVFDTQAGTYTTLPMLPGVYDSRAFDVNDSGLVAGSMTTPTAAYAYVYNIQAQQVVAQIPSGHPDGRCWLSGINASGMACGTRTIEGPPFYAENAFVWSSPTGVVDLGVMNGPRSGASDIADDGVVIGWTGDLNTINQHAFTYQNGRTQIWAEVPNGLNSWGVFANADGQRLVSGWVTPQSPPIPASSHTFLVQDSSWIELVPLPTYSTSIGAAITNSGLVVGASNAYNAPDWLACGWNAGVPFSLFDLADLDPTIHYFRNVTDVCDDGRVVVMGYLATDSVSYVLSPVMAAPGDTKLRRNCERQRSACRHQYVGSMRSM